MCGEARRLHGRWWPRNASSDAFRGGAAPIDDLRSLEGDGSERLEDIFLRLTGEATARGLVEVLDA